MKHFAFAVAAVATAFAPLPAGAASTDLVVSGGHVRSYGWLTTMASDDGNLFTLRIDISDLNPGTPVGWNEMARRVHRGTDALCERAGARPMIDGYDSSVLRECWAGTRAQAAPQMRDARDAAMSGRQVAMLGIALRAE